MDEKKNVIDELKKIGGNLYHIDTGFHSKCDIANCLEKAITKMNYVINELEGNGKYSIRINAFKNLLR